MTVATVDLHAGLDVSTASMSDYANQVADGASRLAHPRVLCGWSMGGLVVMMAAAPASAARLVVLEPSPPADVQGESPDVELSDGTFDPEAVYGAFPAGVRARPESSRARAERKRGVSVPSLPRPSLVVYGDEFADERGRRIAERYGCDERRFPGLDHWALVREPIVRAAVACWIGSTLGGVERPG